MISLHIKYCYHPSMIFICNGITLAKKSRINQKRTGRDTFPFIMCALFSLSQLIGARVVSAQDTLLVATASNFRHAGDAIFNAFETASGVTIKASFGSTGKLVAQIEHGAPFEVFLAADDTSSIRLKTKHLVSEGSEITYALGQLALWYPAGLESRPLSSSPIFEVGQTISLANPKLAPYGKAAEEALSALKKMGLSETRRLVGQSIAQSFQFVASGNASLGFVALSQLKAAGVPNAQWLLVPAEHYSDIRQQAMVLVRGESNPASQALIQFLNSDKAKQIMRKYGYLFSEDSP